MPVDYIGINEKIKEIGTKAKKFYDDLDEKKNKAGSLLQQYSEQNELLHEIVRKVLEKNNKLRCAVPLAEPLNGHISAEAAAEPYSILAADGSQINPSRHDPIPFGLINTGAFYICPAGNMRPMEYKQSLLLSYEDVYTEEGLLSERNVSLIRDFHERKFLAELAKERQQETLITLTDGPLELYHEQLETKTYREYFSGFIKALTDLQKTNSIVAGYIDKPYSDLVVRLLELTLLKKEEYEKVGKKRFFTGTADWHLFDEILQPGERSAIFRIQSLSSDKLNPDLVPHFFYFKPQNAFENTLARVEIPAWITSQPEQINLLHFALNEECRQLGSKAYPYSLHRAHEIALVQLNEKKDIENRITSELLSKNIRIEGISQKQGAKDLTQFKTRY